MSVHVWSENMTESLKTDFNFFVVIFTTFGKQKDGKSTLFSQILECSARLC